MNSKWPRWIAASIIKHIADLAEADNYAVFVEGDTRIAKADNFIEIRMDGPYFRGTTKNNWKIKVEVNVLIQQRMDGSNLYSIKDVQGDVCTYLTDIVLYQYGDGDAKFGCLRTLNAEREKDHLVVSNFGRIEPDTDIEQSTVEVHYETDLEG